MGQRITVVALITAMLAIGAVAAAGNAAAASVSLEPQERVSLLFVREEEKLARDVYRAMIRRYGLRPFTRIAPSEERHMAAVKVLLDRYGVPDPAAGRAEGSFADPTIQRRYDTLVAKGNRSLAGAMQVGVAIEKADIADLTARLRAIDQADIRTVFVHLREGSQHHLAAFQR